MLRSTKAAKSFWRATSLQDQSNHSTRRGPRLIVWMKLGVRLASFCTLVILISLKLRRTTYNSQDSSDAIGKSFISLNQSYILGSEGLNDPLLVWETEEEDSLPEGSQGMALSGVGGVDFPCDDTGRKNVCQVRAAPGYIHKRALNLPHPPS